MYKITHSLRLPHCTLYKELDLPFIPFLGMLTELDNVTLRVKQVLYAHFKESFDVVYELYDMSETDYYSTAQAILEEAGWESSKRKIEV